MGTTVYNPLLIDSHPEVSDVLRSVIYSSDYCVSPVKFDRQSSIGVATVIGEINNVNADVELIKNSLDGDLQYTDTIFSGSIGMMAREWGGDLKRTEYLERNRLRRTGNVFLITYQAHPVSQSARIVPSSLKIGSRRWHAIGFSFRRATA